MSSNWKKYACGALLACLSLLASGCGSSVSTSAPETIPVSGKAVKGPISGALVTAYKMDALGNPGTEAIASTTSDNLGDYTLNIPKGSGPIIIVVRGTESSTYINEATGAPAAFKSDETLRAVVVDPAAVESVPVTPFTDMAVAKIQEYAADAAATGAPIPSITTLNTAATNVIENAVKFMTGAETFSLSDVSSTSSDTALTLFAQLLATQSAADPTVNSTTLSQSFVNAITVGGDSLTTLNTQITAAADVLQQTQPDLTITPTPIPVVTAPDFADTTPPATPINLNKSTAFNEVILTWNASAEAAGYFVYRNGVKIATVSTPGYTDATVSASTTYVYAVEAFDANGNISAPGTLTVTTPAAPLPGSLDIIVNGQVKTQ